MNDYIAGILAREHHDMLMTNAVAARLASEANSHRGRVRSSSRRRPTAGSPGGRFLSGPVTAFQSWLAAGNL